MCRCVKWFVLSSTVFAAVAAVAAVAYENEDQSEWQRVSRITVYDSPGQARYPAITKATDGALLVLFSVSQPEVSLGNLMLARSADNGKSWSRPHVEEPEQKPEQDTDLFRATWVG